MPRRAANLLYIILAIAISLIIIISLTTDHKAQPQGSGIISTQTSWGRDIEKQRGSSDPETLNGTSNTQNPSGFAVEELHIRGSGSWFSIELIEAFYNSSSGNLSAYITIRTPNPCYKIEAYMTNESPDKPALYIKISDPLQGLHCISIISKRSISASMYTPLNPGSLIIRIMATFSQTDVELKIPIKSQ
jgi:hypothetical protein